MNRLLLQLSGIGLALVVAACGEQTPAQPEDPAGGSAGTTAASGGGGAGGSTGGNPAGGSPASGSGGMPGGNAGSTGGGSGGSAGNSNGGSAGSAIGGGGASGSAGMAGQAGTTGGAPNGGAGATSGGAGASGAAGGGATPPELVTSAENDYWNTEGTLTTAASGTADLTVDPNTKYQVFTGFGGTFNEMGWDALSVLSAEEVTRALTLLFHPTEGANFVYGRLPMGASDYAMSWYTLAETANDYEMNDFSIERDREMLIPFTKAAREIRPDLQLWASPWVVPSWMMSGGSMRNDAQTLSAHALYMARFVQAYAAEGLEIIAVHPQNEPGYARVRWTQAQFIDFIKTYLGPTFAEEELTAEIWVGTMSKNPEDTNIARAAAADPDAMMYVKGFGVQWNLQAAVLELAESAPVWQTEHKCGNYNFETPYWDQSRYDPNQPQNDHLYGEESWQLIRDWIVSGVHSYSAWNMVLDTFGKSLDNWPQNALLTVDRTARTLIVTPAYYAFRHFSRYITPGATRIAITGSTDAVAFLNPDGSIATNVYNKDSAPKPITVAVGGAFHQFEVPSHGWATLRTGP